jgi:RNA polymerase sigma-70 factor (ECF subfamily)
MVTDSGADRREIVIDPVSGQYIGERMITVHGFGAIPAGTAMESTSVTLSVADRAP